MTRHAALILLSISAFALATLACNLPGVSQQPEVTQTFVANVTLTANYNLTLAAQQTSLSLTQTAAVPTPTSAATDTPTAAPTSASTNIAAATSQAASTVAATTNATANATSKVAAGGTPTQTSIANDTLKVGVEALVRVTGGVPLNIRDTPGKKGKIIARAPADTRVKIVDGPQAADGVLWWQITVLTSSSSDALDKTGWCAEFAESQTLEAAK